MTWLDDYMIFILLLIFVSGVSEENSVSNCAQICHDTIPRSRDLNNVNHIQFISLYLLCCRTFTNLCLFLLLQRNFRRNIWNEFINWLWKSKIWAVKYSFGFLHLLLVKEAGCFAVLVKLVGLYYYGSIEGFLEKG